MHRSVRPILWALLFLTPLPRSARAADPAPEGPTTAVISPSATSDHSRRNDPLRWTNGAASNSRPASAAVRTRSSKGGSSSAARLTASVARWTSRSHGTT